MTRTVLKELVSEAGMETATVCGVRLRRPAYCSSEDWRRIWGVPCGPQVTVVDPAMAPEAPIKPKNKTSKRPAKEPRYSPESIRGGLGT